MVEGHHIPPRRVEDEAVGIDVAVAGDLQPRAIRDAQPLPRPGGRAQSEQQTGARRVGLRHPGRTGQLPVAGRIAHGEPQAGPQRGEAVRQGLRQHPDDLRLRRRGRRGLRGQPDAVGRHEPEHDGDRLVVGEHQRRQLEARQQPVAAIPAPLGGHRDAQIGQVARIAPDGALVDRQPPGEVADRHPAMGLEELEHREHPGSGGSHAEKSPSNTGRKLPGIPSTFLP
jgi:hypothetical protein